MESPSVKKEFVLGVFFVAVSKYIGLFLQIVISAILARLVEPSDFGVVAVATIIIQFFSTLYEAGLGTAIIQNKEFQNKDYDSIFTLSTLLGIFFFLIFFFSSDFIARYYENESLSDICKWLSLTVIIGAMNVAPNSILLKDKKFKLLSIRSLVAQIFAGVVSIYMAFSGYGVYALVASVIIANVLIFGFNYALYPLKLNFRFDCIKEVLSYSLFQFLSNLIAYLSRNMDKLIIGKLLGMSPLGYYEKSYKLMMMPLQNITFVITPVLHPIFSNFQNDLNSIVQKYMKLLKTLAYIGFPLTVFLYFCAAELILVFFGSQWYDSILAFKILSLTAGIQVLNSTCGSIFQSIGSTKELFISCLLSFLFMASGLYIACVCFKTVESVAYAFDITLVIGVVIVFSILFRKLKVSIVDFLKTMSSPVILFVLLFGFMFVYSEYVVVENLILSAVLKFVIIFSLAVSYMLYVKVISFSDIKNICNKIIKRNN